jgi:hypothetical protein
VDGSLGAWTFIMSDLYPQLDAPPLTLGGVYVLLPVVHKYNFTKLLTRLVDFIKEKSEALSTYPSNTSTYIIRWLEMAECLQLDELREVCISRLRGMTKQQLDLAILIPGSGKNCGVREEVKRLGPALCFELLAIGMRK